MCGVCVCGVYVCDPTFTMIKDIIIIEAPSGWQPQPRMMNSSQLSHSFRSHKNAVSMEWCQLTRVQIVFTIEDLGGLGFRMGATLSDGRIFVGAPSSSKKRAKLILCEFMIEYYDGRMCGRLCDLCDKTILNLRTHHCRFFGLYECVQCNHE